MSKISLELLKEVLYLSQEDLIAIESTSLKSKLVNKQTGVQEKSEQFDSPQTEHKAKGLEERRICTYVRCTHDCFQTDQNR